jgi:hypothetical protein
VASYEHAYDLEAYAKPGKTRHGRTSPKIARNLTTRRIR